MAPLCCDVEASELSCQHTRRDSDPNRYLLLLFDSQKGGAGAAPKMYAHWEELLSKAVELMENCKCDEGCPNCIIAAHCGEYNHGLDKQAALKIGHALGYGTVPEPSVMPSGTFTEIPLPDSFVASAREMDAALQRGPAHRNGTAPAAAAVAAHAPAPAIAMAPPVTFTEIPLPASFVTYPRDSAKPVSCPHVHRAGALGASVPITASATPAGVKTGDSGTSSALSTCEKASSIDLAIEPVASEAVTKAATGVASSRAFGRLLATSSARQAATSTEASGRVCFDLD